MARKEQKKRKERYKLRINRRETLYVDDEPEHAMMMVELVGKPIEYEPGIAGEFVSRRSVTFQDLVGGSGSMQGYVMANFKHGSVYSRFAGQREEQSLQDSLPAPFYVVVARLAPLIA